MDSDPNDDTPGKKPPAPSVSQRPSEPLTLFLRKTKAQVLIAGWNPNIWGKDDYCILHGDVVVGRIYPEIIKGRAEWLWFLQTEPAPPPNSGVAGSLEDAKTRFKAYQQVKANREPREYAALGRRSARPVYPG
jgi:hypothetical protein